TAPCTARRPTCGRAGTRAATRCSARPEPPSGSTAPTTSPGTSASSTTRSTRSSSRSRSRTAASAPTRPPRWRARSSRSGSTSRSSTSRASRRRSDRMTPPVSTPIHDVDDVPAASTTRAVTLALPFDPILLLAVIGLCAASLVTISGATSDDIAGDPNYYVNRQGIYFVIGTVMAVILARIDYSRLRGAKYAVYGLLIASILAVSALGSV